MSAPYIQGADGQWYYLASDNNYYPCAALEPTYTTQYDPAEAGSFQGDDPNESNEPEYEQAGPSVPSHVGPGETGNEVWSPGRSRRERKRDVKETMQRVDNILGPIEKGSKKDDSKKSKDESKRKKKK